jgi:PHD/YefM family antitoxin component YafN of YafNO toxin-antitoxin module
MITKSISSTQAQNNFGRVLDDINHNQVRYIVERRGIPQIIMLSLDDFASVLASQSERQSMSQMIAEVRPEYRLGQVLKPTTDQ